MDPLVVNYTTSWLDDGCSGGPFVPRSCSYSFSRDNKVHQRRATGDSTDASLDEVVARLSDLGYTVQKLPGPLLLATTGGNRQVPKLMPTFMRSVEVCRAVELSSTSLTLDAAVAWSQGGSVEVCRVAQSTSIGWRWEARQQI